MKKSVLVLIMIVYIASIVIIGFFGVKVETFNVTIYVQEISLLNDNIVMDLNNIDKYIMIQYIPNPETVDGLAEGQYSADDPFNPNYVQLLWKVLPEETTFRDVTFEHADNTKATVNAFGTVIFTGKTTLTIYITSTDGTNVRQKIKVVAY